jgi:ATP-dependent helicase/DNAse subunit B
VPVGLNKDGSLSKRGSQVADEATIYKFIQHWLPRLLKEPSLFKPTGTISEVNLGSKRISNASITLDIRLEPKFTSDIVPVGLNKDGSLSKRGSQVADHLYSNQLAQYLK